MKVISILKKDFEKVCFELSDKVIHDYKPDIIIGVLTGGGYVARNIKKRFETSNYYYEIKVQRSTTKTKQKIRIDKFFKLLPYFILNWLRIIESHYFELKRRFVDNEPCGEIVLPTELIELLKNGGHKVLIIDDSIDTGSTILILKNSIENVSKNNQVRVAVINVTQHKPYVFPDYYLFYRVLIRFPWSSDAK